MGSLYRPKTKKGDPRIWFYGIKLHTTADDVWALFVEGGKIYGVNLSRCSLDDIESNEQTQIAALILDRRRRRTNAAEELLGRLREIAARGPMEALCKGATAIGRTLEHALGIEMNSSPYPDFKGIEIKAGRTSLTGRDTRPTLFACVPTWSRSRLKSSAAILEEHGYDRDGTRKLYCTVSTRTPNSQGLQFELLDSDQILREFYNNSSPREVCVWELETLHKKLIQKHRETFWVRAASETIAGREHFCLTSVVHTSKPDCRQFDRLLADGTITMDHLIKEVATGGAREKGPLFKITRGRLGELFLGETQRHVLV